MFLKQKLVLTLAVSAFLMNCSEKVDLLDSTLPILPEDFSSEEYLTVNPELKGIYLQDTIAELNKIDSIKKLEVYYPQVLAEVNTLSFTDGESAQAMAVSSGFAWADAPLRSYNAVANNNKTKEDFAIQMVGATYIVPEREADKKEFLSDPAILQYFVLGFLQYDSVSSTLFTDGDYDPNIKTNFISGVGNYYNIVGRTDEVEFAQNFQFDTVFVAQDYIQVGKTMGRPYRYCTENDSKAKEKSSSFDVKTADPNIAYCKDLTSGTIYQID